MKLRPSARGLTEVPSAALTIPGLEPDLACRGPRNLRKENGQGIVL